MPMNIPRSLYRGRGGPGGGPGSSMSRLMQMNPGLMARLMRSQRAPGSQQQGPPAAPPGIRNQPGQQQGPDFSMMGKALQKMPGQIQGMMANPAGVAAEGFAGPGAEAMALQASEFGLGSIPGMAPGLGGFIPPGAAGAGLAGAGAVGAGAGALGAAGAGLGAAGLAGLGTAGAAGGALGILPFLMMSDRRLKTDIHPIGVLPNGLEVFSFRYIWDDHKQVGVMADQVKQIMPHAVFDVGGFDAVDYRAII